MIKKTKNRLNLSDDSVYYRELFYNVTGTYAGNRKTTRRNKMPAKVDQSTCTGCEACVSACPTEAIVMEDGKAKVTDDCIDCGACVDECPVEAISMD